MITTHTGWGEGADVMGVYATPEAARAALERQPNMRVHAIGDGHADCDRYHPGLAGAVIGEPVDEDVYPCQWAAVEKYQVER